MFLTPFSSWKTSWVIIALIVVLIAAKIYEIRVKILIRRRANEPFVDANYPSVPLETPNLHSDVGEKLPVESSGEGVSRDRAKDGCSICLDQFGDDVAVLRCDHLFHLHCIVAWTTNNKWCPLCRRAVHRVVVAKMELGFGDDHGADIESQ